ncbi:MAG: nitroreductase/quinone reductase family protein [Anaerolineae bacterium]
MSVRNRASKLLWRLIRFPPRLLYALGLGPICGRLVLLLTAIGRKSGLPRVTPLQYEVVNGTIYVASARGQRADWFRNIVANPEVEVRVKSRKFRGLAEPITDPERVADFLELRLRRHPRMIGAMFRAAGLPAKPTRAQIEQYASQRALVAIRPTDDGGDTLKGDSQLGAFLTAMALFRAIELSRPEAERLFDDPISRELLPLPWRILLLPGLRHTFVAVAERLGPGALGNLFCRTRYIDDVLRAALEEGLDQVVVLGAGFDTRAYRIPGIDQTHVKRL